MKGLTEKQKNMIGFIDEFVNTMGMAPTIYEIAEHFKIKTSTVFAHVRALQKKGYLTRSSKARSISLTRQKKKNRIPAGAASIPVIDAAGHPAQDVICDSKVFHRIASSSKDLFAMHVKGSELHNLGILDGDIVILKSHPVNIANGDIVLTELNGRDVFRSCKTLSSGDVNLSAGGKDTGATGKIADFPVKGLVIGLQRSI